MATDEKNKVKSITLVLTHRCNLHCTYCYEKNKDSTVMSYETAISIIDRELTLDDGIDRVEIDFFGGEPLLEFDTIRRVVETVRTRDYKKSFIFFITTNGVPLDEERKKWFEKNTDILQMGLSLDGTREMHNINRSNSYDLIDIDFFKRVYPEQGVKMTISNATLNTLAEGVLHCQKLGFDVSCNLAYGIDWTSKENETVYMRELKKLVDHYLAHPDEKPCALLDINRLKGVTSSSKTSLRHCGAGWAMKSYDCDGTFYPCQHFLPLSIGKEKAIDSLKIDFANQAVNIDLFNQECKTCIMKNVCPTCYGENYSATGNINTRDMSLCKMFKIQFKALAYFAGEMFCKGLLDNMDKSQLALILKGAMEINNKIII